MSLTDAIVNIHYFIRYSHVVPYYFDRTSEIFALDPHYFKPRNIMCRILINLCLLFYYVVVVIRAIWLLFHWKSYTIYNLEQGIVYLFLVNGGFLLIHFIFMLSKHKTWLVQMINQIIGLVLPNNVPAAGVQLKLLGLKIPTYGQLLLYAGMCIAVFIAAPAIGIAPFAVDWCPLQIFLQTNHLLVKAIAGTMYASIVLVIALQYASFLLVLVAITDGMHAFTLTLTARNNTTRTQFRLKHKKFCMACLLVEKGNQVLDMFLAILIFVGILIASCSGYAVLKMYSILNFISYFGLLSLFVACIAVALALTYMANLSRTKLAMFTEYWAVFQLNKEERKMLSACKPTGFSVGAYGIATSKLGLYICDDIVRNTVAMTLLN